MIKKIIIGLIVISSNTCIAQNADLIKNGQKNLRGDTLDDKFKILYIIKGLGTVPKVTENFIFDTGNVDSVSNIPNGRTVEIRKELKVSIIVILSTKIDVKFLTLNEIFNTYKIPEEDQKLPIRIDNWIVENPETIIADQSEIVFVGVNKNPEGINFINITTHHPLIINKRKRRTGVNYHNK